MGQTDSERKRRAAATDPMHKIETEQGASKPRRLTAYVLAVLMSMAVVAVAFRACAQVLTPQLKDILEPGRVSPQAKVKLPHVEVQTDRVDYFIEPYGTYPTDKPYPLVHLRLPRAAFFDPKSRLPVGPYRVFETYLTVIYPEMLGLLDVKNALCIEQIQRQGGRGRCANEVRIRLLQPLPVRETNFTQRDYQILLDEMSNGWVKPPTKPLSVAGLELYAVRFEGRVDEDKYYLSRDENGVPDLIVKCVEQVVVPSCTARTNTSKAALMALDVNFVAALLPEWRNVMSRARDFADSLIVRTYYLSQDQ